MKQIKQFFLEGESPSLIRKLNRLCEIIFEKKNVKKAAPLPIIMGGLILKL